MEIYISNAGQSPIYAQITSQIKEKILSGELKTGEALPSIRLLAKELRISVITTKRAYEELEREGFIYTVPAKGCYVAKKNTELLREENLKQIEAKDFVKTESGAVVMKDEARKTVLAAWQKRKQTVAVHPFLGDKVPIGLFPHLQALLLARHLRGDLDAYPPFIVR